MPKPRKLKAGGVSEAGVVDSIKAAIKREGGKCYKLHGSPFAVAGSPDLIGVLSGRMFVLEVKRPDGPGPTKLQLAELMAWARQGVKAGVARNAQQALSVIHCAQENGVLVYKDGGLEATWTPAEAPGAP